MMANMSIEEWGLTFIDWCAMTLTFAVLANDDESRTPEQNAAANEKIMQKIFSEHCGLKLSEKIDYKKVLQAQPQITEAVLRKATEITQHGLKESS